VIDGDQIMAILAVAMKRDGGSRTTRSSRPS
jgi:hypothetical protein